MSIQILKHVSPTNVTRLRLALDTLEDESPRPARERLQQAIACLEGATPGRTTSEQATCRLCRDGARRLQAMLHAPPRAPWRVPQE